MRDVTLDTVDQLSTDELSTLVASLATDAAQHRKEWPLLYYQPVSPKALEVHLAPERFLGVGGGNRACLPLTHAHVLMANGTFRRLYDVTDTDQVIGCNPDGSDARPVNVVRTFRSGVRRVYEFTRTDGQRWYATKDHLVPVTITNKHMEWSTPEKREIGELFLSILEGNVAAITPRAIQLWSPHRTWEPPDATNAQLERVRWYTYADCGDLEVDHPGHCYLTDGYTVVSNSKTETCLADAMICATGVIPTALRDVYPRDKIRGPMNVRIVCTSHTTTTDLVILKKLKWFEWSGLPPHGGPQGHWGWIPKACLLDEDWTKSWSATQRTLRFHCLNPDDLTQVLGESMIQIMSHDQEAEKFASAEFHIVLCDEPPPHDVYNENVMRIGSVDGRMMVAMTWPDDPAIPVDWLHTELYEPGLPGPGKHPSKRWIELSAFDNPNIRQDTMHELAGTLTDLQRRTRIEGKPIRFAHRVHPLFTPDEDTWCFVCGKPTYVVNEQCQDCRGHDTVAYTHVDTFDVNESWPTIWLLDPHPRKPHMWLWAQLDPNDDYWIPAAGELALEPSHVANEVLEWERQARVTLTERLMDPNMGASPAGKHRDISWQDEFESAGLACRLADDSSVGRSRVNTWLTPDLITRRPRITFHRDGAALAITQMNRYAWDDYKLSLGKGQKQTPKPLYDDYPTLLKYLANAHFSFQTLHHGYEPLCLVGPGRTHGY